MAVRRTFTLWNSLFLKSFSSSSHSQQTLSFPRPLSLRSLSLSSPSLSLSWPSSSFGNTRRFLTTLSEEKKDIALDNKTLKTLQMDVYTELNTFGLRFPVSRPEQHLVKPSGFIIPSPERCREYPFYISRTKSFNLPVYSDMKKSGRCLTILRRIAGSMDELEKELQKFIPKDRIIRKEGHFKIKGHYTKVLRGWLHGLGF